jgi:L-fuconolactonase
VIDAHLHSWRLDRGDYEWLSAEAPDLNRDFGIEDWRAVAGACGVTGGVLVQATPTAAETAFMLELADRASDQILGVVGWAELDAADAVAEVERLAVDRRVVAVRPWLQAISDPDWILSARVAPALAALAAAGLRYEALIRPVHLSRIRILAERHPELPVIIDHSAKPDIAADCFQPWADELRRLATNPVVSCKLSGLLTEAGNRTGRDQLQPYVEVVLEAFGADRVLWGSDWPVVTSVSDYAHWFELARSLVPTQWHAAVFDGTARQVYGLCARDQPPDGGPKSPQKA